MSKLTRSKRIWENFPSTCWTRVLAAGQKGCPTDQAAFQELCESYWYPIYAFIRRHGFVSHEARDLTQSYFVRLMERDLVSKADETKGKFRDFVRRDCSFFLIDQVNRLKAQKRGGNVEFVSVFDEKSEEVRYAIEPLDTITPERLFNREWALALLDRALKKVEVEYQKTGRTALFECLNPFLVAGATTQPYRTIAKMLDTNEKTIEAAVRRLRKRYRFLLMSEIAATLESPDDESVQDELNFLFESLKIHD